MTTSNASPASAAFTPAELARRTLQRRGVEAAIWGMPLVSVDAMRQASLRDAGAKTGDILYLSKPADWRFQATTPNATMLSAYFNFNLADGPVVVDVPASIGAQLSGTFIDAWERPLADAGADGEDQGMGGSYLLLPPGDTPALPDGPVPIRSCTMNGYALFQAMPASSWPEDQERAIALVKSLRVYPLASADNPPAQRHIDISGRLFNGVARFDDSFYDALARMVHEEPVQTRDIVVMAQLKSLGIEKGKAFKPDQATRDVLKTAIAEAHALFMNAASAGQQPYWPGSRWMSLLAAGPPTGFNFETGERLDIDERAAMFFLADAMPKNQGSGCFQIGAFRDATGNPFKGDDTYRLRIPGHVPVKHSWTVTVYDLATAAFIRNAPRVAIESGDRRLMKNGDGSVDVYFGPTAPVGKESNWIFTAPRKPWFAFFRFHGPERAVLDRTWVLPNIERAR